MKRIVSVVLAAAFLLSIPSNSTALPDGLRVDLYKGGLDFPIDMAWVQGTKKVFFTQKSGKIRIMVRGNVRPRACKTLDVDGSAESGALGLALDPDFKTNHFLYVFYTNRSPHDNRVTRFKVVDNRCRQPEHLITGLQAQDYHNGGQLEFVGGKLFISTGEAHDPSRAQDTNDPHGKILRINPDGSVPGDNPFGNRVWSYGHRNPFGLTHKPGTNRLYETENGPSCDDEFNRIKKGRNYGWGSGYDCGTNGVGEDPVGPLRRWSNIIVPTDPVWYRGKLRLLNSDIYVGDFSRGRLHRLRLNERGTKVKSDRIIYNADEGIVDVSKGPGGFLYFLTSSGIYRIVRE